MDNLNEGDLTADISDAESLTANEEHEDVHDSEKSASPDTSTTTIVGENPMTPQYTDYHRKSLSQPVLSRDRIGDLGPRCQSQVLKPARIPFLQVQEENQTLQHRVFELQAELNQARYREREALQQLPRNVQDIMEEFYSLQQGRMEAESSVKKFLEMEADLDKTKKEKRKVEKELEGKIQQLTEKNEKLQQKYNDLREEMNEAEDFTLASDADADSPTDLMIANELALCRQKEAEYGQKIASLENEVEMYRQKLIMAEQVLHENTAAAKTFVMGGNEELVAKLDELEQQKAEWIENDMKLRSVLLNYMTRVTKLEKKLQTASLSSAQFNLSTFDFGDTTKMIEFLEKVKTELLTSADKNRSLRRECNRLLGRNEADVTANKTFEIGKKSPVFDQTTEEKATPNPANVSVIDDSFVQVNNDLINFVDNIITEIKEGGGSSFLENASFRDDSSSLNAPGIDMENRSAEMLARFENPTFANEAIDHVTMLNSSMSMILQTSMNAAADITNVKNRLGSLREVMMNMFERLKSSATLFDEIRQYLAGEGHSEVCDKIREMQLIWSSSADEAKEIKDAVDHAEQSIHGLQAHISVLEQSIVQTSFVLDQTRRMTLANASELHLSRLSLNPINNPSIEQENALAEARLELQIQTENAKERESELTNKITELTSAKEQAESRAEIVKKQLDGVELRNSELQMRCEELMSEAELVKSDLSKTKDKLAEAERTVVDLKETVASLQREAEMAQEDLQEEKLAVDRHRSEVDALTNTRNELAVKAADAMAKHQEAETKIKDYSEKIYQLEETIREQQIQVKTMNNDLSSLQQSLRDKNNDLDVIRDQANDRIRVLENQLGGSRQNADNLQMRVNALEAEVETLKTPAPRLSRPDGNVMDISLIQRSSMPNRQVQTDITIQNLERMERELVGAKSELKSMYDAHAALDAGLRKFLYDNSNGDHLPLMTLQAVKTNSEALLKGLEKSKELQDKTRQELNKLQKDLTESMKSSSESASKSSRRSPITYTKTPLDEYKYKNKLRQDAFSMMSIANDLTQNLKKADSAQQRDFPFSLTPLIEDSRDLRTRLHDLYQLTNVNKENMPAMDTEQVAVKFNFLLKSNEELFNALNKCKSELKDLSKKATHPDLVARINAELSSIHQVMSKASSAAGGNVLGSRPSGSQ